MNDTDVPAERPSSAATSGTATRFDIHRADHDRTLAAVHRLEAAINSAAFGRQSGWVADVSQALSQLASSTTEEQRNALQPDSLLADIAHTQPRLRNRVRGLRTGYQQLRDRIDTINDRLDDDDLDIHELRRRLAELMNAIRHQQARESDLIYEAYYTTYRHDIEDDATNI